MDNIGKALNYINIFNKESGIRKGFNAIQKKVDNFRGKNISKNVEIPTEPGKDSSSLSSRNITQKQTTDQEHSWVDHQISGTHSKPDEEEKPPEPVGVTTKSTSVEEIRMQKQKVVLEKIMNRFDSYESQVSEALKPGGGGEEKVRLLLLDLIKIVDNVNLPGVMDEPGAKKINSRFSQFKGLVRNQIQAKRAEAVPSSAISPELSKVKPKESFDSQLSKMQINVDIPKAEIFLKGKEDGTWLVRPTSIVGEYAISIVKGGIVNHGSLYGLKISSKEELLGKFLEAKRLDGDSLTPAQSILAMLPNLKPSLDSKNPRQEVALNTKLVWMQIQTAVDNIEANKDAWIAEAKAKDSPGNPGYVYKRGFKLQGKGLEASYSTAHIQVNADGRIFLIPKNPKLVLGRGNFKRVRTAIEYGTEGRPSKMVAFASAKGTDSKLVNDAKREVDIANQMLADNGGDKLAYILYADPTRIGEKGSKFKSIMPIANRGDLFDNIADGLLDKKQKNQVCLAMLQWIKSMHDYGIINADIKPENILLNIDEDGNLEIFILDLGLSYYESDITSIEDQLHGTPEFVSPEIWRGISNPDQRKLDGKKIDIFALGITMFQLYTGDYYPEYVIEALVEPPDAPPQLNPDEFEELWNKYSPSDHSIDRLIRQMIHPKPHCRPTIEQVLSAISEIEKGNELSDSFENECNTTGVKLAHDAALLEYADILSKHDDTFADLSKELKPDEFRKKLNSFMWDMEAYFENDKETGILSDVDIEVLQVQVDEIRNKYLPEEYRLK